MIIHGGPLLYSTDSKTSQEIDSTDIDTHIHDDLKKENNRLRMELATVSSIYSKTCLKWLLKKRPKIGFQYRSLLNAGQKYCIIIQWEHSAILSTFIKLPFTIKTFVWSFF